MTGPDAQPRADLLSGRTVALLGGRRQGEARTADLISIDRRHQAHDGVRVTDL